MSRKQSVRMLYKRFSRTADSGQTTTEANALAALLCEMNHLTTCESRILKRVCLAANPSQRMIRFESAQWHVCTVGTGE